MLTRQGRRIRRRHPSGDVVLHISFVHCSARALLASQDPSFPSIFLSYVRAYATTTRRHIPQLIPPFHEERSPSDQLHSAHRRNRVLVSANCLPRPARTSEKYIDFSEQQATLRTQRRLSPVLPEDGLNLAGVRSGCTSAAPCS
ncbi:hypothetical protein OF83DRAFT_104841 [Amylostereum chailletii]|nr:hypothetical protein OF83DRAFT_104841 [Amylostereum chailletii]